MYEFMPSILSKGERGGDNDIVIVPLWQMLQRSGLSYPSCNDTITTMEKRRISKSQAVSIILIWVLLVAMLLHWGELNFFTLFSLFASGVIVFVPLYKRTNWKK